MDFNISLICTVKQKQKLVRGRIAAKLVMLLKKFKFSKALPFPQTRVAGCDPASRHITGVWSISCTFQAQDTMRIFCSNIWPLTPVPGIGVLNPLDLLLLLLL